MMRTWRAPRRVVREHLSLGQREDRSIAFLIIGCLLIFIAQWPRLSRTAHEDGEELSRLIAYEFFAWLIIWPLIFYILALLLFWVLRVARVQVTSWQVRMALFWAFLAASPAGLFYGLLIGFTGSTTGAKLVGIIWLAAILVFAVQGLRESGRRDGG